MTEDSDLGMSNEMVRYLQLSARYEQLSEELKDTLTQLKKSWFPAVEERDANLRKLLFDNNLGICSFARIHSELLVSLDRTYDNPEEIGIFPISKLKLHYLWLEFRGSNGEFKTTELLRRFCAQHYPDKRNYRDRYSLHRVVEIRNGKLFFPTDKKEAPNIPVTCEVTPQIYRYFKLPILPEPSLFREFLSSL